MKISLILFNAFFLISNLSASDELFSGSTISPPNEHWIEWDSPEGLKRLDSSKYKTNLPHLLRYYESQIRGSYCGIATAVITFNALKIKPSPSRALNNPRMFTQENFFDGEIEKAVDSEVVKKQGLSLNEMAKVLRTQPLNVSVYAGLSLSDQEIRSKVMSALTNPDQSVIVLYQRKVLEQIGSGHWSPIAAYDQESDSFLILDVARFKYPPVWISANSLIDSIRSPNIEGASRGFIVLESSLNN